MANANTNLMSFNPIRPTNSTNRTQPAKSSRENYGLKNSQSNTPANSSQDKKSNFGAELDKANAQVNQSQSQNEDVQTAAATVEGEHVNETVKALTHGKSKNKQDAPQDQIKNLPADENSKLVTGNLVENLVNEVIDNQIVPQVQTEIPVDVPQNIPQNVDVELETENISQPLIPTLTAEIPVDIPKASINTTEKFSPTIPVDIPEENFDSNITENPVDVENVPVQNLSDDIAFYFTSTTENLLTTQNSNADVDKSNLMSIMPQARDDKAQSMLDILSGKIWKSPKQTSETPELIQAELPQDIPTQTQPTLTSAYTVQSQFATRKLDFRPLKVQAQLQNPLTQAQPTLQTPQIQIPLTEGQPTLQPQIQIPLVEGQPTLQTPQVEIPLTQAQPTLQTQSQVQVPLTNQPTLQTPQIEVPLTQTQPLQTDSQIQISLTNQPTLQTPQVEIPLTQTQPLQTQSQVQVPLTNQLTLQTPQIEVPLTQTQPLQTQSQVQVPLTNQQTLQTPQVEVPLTQAQPLQTQSQVQIPLTNQQTLQTPQVEVPFTQVKAPADVPVAQGQSTIQPQFELPLTQNNPTLQAQPQVQQRQFGAEIQPQVNVLQAQFIDSKTVNRQEVSQFLGVQLQVENQPSTPIMPLQSTSNQFEQNPQQQQQSMQNFRQTAQFTTPNVEVEQQVAEQLPKGTENFTANLVAVNNTPQTQPTAQVQAPEIMQAPREDFNVPAQIVEQARMIRTAANTEMVINLKPEHLGELTLRVSVSTNGAVTASFYSDNAQVRAVIENTIVQLKQELNDQGLKVDNVEVYAGLNEDGLLNGQGQQAWQQNQQQRNRRGQVNLNVVEEEIDALNPVTENISADGVDYKV